LRDGTWVTTEGGERVFLYYEEMEQGTLSQLWKPLGGFCYDANIFANLPLPTTPFYIENWLPKPGKMVLYAPAKAGKSFMCVQLARCIASGEPFVGLKTDKSRVLYLQFELGMAVLQQRMASTGRSYDGVYVGTSFDLLLDSANGQGKLRTAIDAVKPQVVILDPLYKLMRGDENESQDLLVVLNFLDNMIEEFDCSFVLVHHMGKDSRRGARGSSVLEGYPDAYIELKKLEHSLKLCPKLLRHSALPTQDIEVVMDKFEFVLKEEQLAMPTIKQRVLGYIGASLTPVSPRALLDMGIGSNRSVHDALAELTRTGQLVKVRRGGYALPGGDYPRVPEIDLAELEM